MTGMPPDTVYPPHEKERRIHSVDSAQAARERTHCAKVSPDGRPVRETARKETTRVDDRPVPAADRTVARGGPRQLAQAAAHRHQDMGASARRARRRGVAVDRDQNRGQARTRIRRGARRHVHGVFLQVGVHSMGTIFQQHRRLDSSRNRTVGTRRPFFLGYLVMRACSLR